MQSVPPGPRAFGGLKERSPASESCLYMYTNDRFVRYSQLVAVTRTIDLKTAIPGPKSNAILERKQRVVAGPLSIVFPIVISEARGATLTDVDGNIFIDFTGGVGCLNVGHSHPRVV